MKDWICDADINLQTVALFKTVANVDAKHIVKDYGIIDTREDDEVINLAKKEKKTLITANYKDFNEKNNVQYVNSPGVWIFNSGDPDEQARLFKLTLEATGMKSTSARKNKKVYIKSKIADVTDVKTGQKQTFQLERKQPKKRKR